MDILGISIRGEFRVAHYHSKDLAFPSEGACACEPNAGRLLQSLPGGFTNLRRFFLSYAFGWCDQYRPELIRILVLTDPHSYPKYRVNNVVSNMPEFKQTFGCQEEQKMVRQNFCRIW